MLDATGWMTLTGRSSPCRSSTLTRLSSCSLHISSRPSPCSTTPSGGKRHHIGASRCLPRVISMKPDWLEFKATLALAGARLGEDARHGLARVVGVHDGNK